MSLVCVPGIVPSGFVIVLCVPIFLFPLGNLLLSLSSVIGWWLEWLCSSVALAPALVASALLFRVATNMHQIDTHIDTHHTRYQRQTFSKWQGRRQWR